MEKKEWSDRIRGRAGTFAAGIAGKYQENGTGAYYSAALVYRRKRNNAVTTQQQAATRFFTNEFQTRMQRYEKKYYQYVTNRDERKFIRTIEQIYNQPGEKKQLIHLFHKLGMINRDGKEWQKTKNSLKQYEEELTQLRRKMEQQEEVLRRREVTEITPRSVKYITREVMEHIRNEMRMERLRYGLDNEWG